MFIQILPSAQESLATVQTTNQHQRSSQRVTYHIPIYNINMHYIDTLYLYHIRTSIKHCASSKPRLPRSTFDRIWTFFKRRLWLDKNGFNKLHFSWQIHPNNQPKLPTSHRWSFQHVLSLHPITCPLQVQNEAAALQRHHLWMHVPLFNSATWYPKFRQFCLKRALVLASFPAPQTRKQKVLGRRNKGTPCS